MLRRQQPSFLQENRQAKRLSPGGGVEFGERPCSGRKGGDGEQELLLLCPKSLDGTAVGRVLCQERCRLRPAQRRS